MPRPGHRCGHYPVFPAGYAGRFRLHVYYFLCTHIQAAPTPPSASFVVSRCFPMADATPALLPFRWPDGQIYFVHPGVGGDVLQDKSASSDDGLIKSLGSHLRSLSHDSLSVNKIIVVSSVMPRACSVFTTHSFYRRALYSLFSSTSIKYLFRKLNQRFLKDRIGCTTVWLFIVQKVYLKMNFCRRLSIHCQ